MARTTGLGTPELASRIEDVLLRVARVGTTPITRTLLCGLVSKPDEPLIDRSQLDPALNILIARHRYDDLRHLVALVVREDTGEVGEEYAKIGRMLPPEEARRAAFAAAEHQRRRAS